MNEKVEKTAKDVKEFGQKAWGQAKGAASKVGYFVKENKEMVAMSIPLAIAAVKAGQSLVVNRRIKGERSRIDHTYYDPATGFHWELRKKPTNADRAEILRRRKAGQETYDILRQMGLIK